MAKCDLLIRECPRIASGEALWAMATGVAVFAIIAVRIAPAWATIRGEDGGIFLDSGLNHGFRSFGHFYSGYLDTIPRVGGALAAALPLRWASFVIATFTVSVVALCAATVEVVSGAHLRMRWARVGLGLAFALLPAFRRPSIAEMASLQFPLTFTVFWVLLWLPRRTAGQVLGATFVAGAALTSLLPVVLAPIAVLRLLKLKGWAIGVSFLLALGSHGLLVLAFNPRRTLHKGSLAKAVKGYGFDVLRSHLFGGPFDGSKNERIHFELWIVLLLLAVGGVVVVILASTRPSDRAHYVALMVVAIGLSVVLYIGQALVDNKEARYAIVPALLLLTAVAAAIDCAGLALGPIRDLGRVFLVSAVCIPSIWSFSLEGWRLAGPRWSPAVAAAKRQCAAGDVRDVQIVTLPIKSTSTWRVDVPCRALR